MIVWPPYTPNITRFRVAAILWALHLDGPITRSATATVIDRCRRHGRDLDIQPGNLSVLLSNLIEGRYGEGLVAADRDELAIRRHIRGLRLTLDSSKLPPNPFPQPEVALEPERLHAPLPTPLSEPVPPEPEPEPEVVDLTHDEDDPLPLHPDEVTMRPVDKLAMMMRWSGELMSEMFTPAADLAELAAEVERLRAERRNLCGQLEAKGREVEALRIANHRIQANLDAMIARVQGPDDRKIKETQRFMAETPRRR